MNEPNRDLTLTFSQAHGYEGLPQPLDLEELSYEARVGIWNILYEHLLQTIGYEELHIGPPWTHILRHLHINHLVMPLDNLDMEIYKIAEVYKAMILDEMEFNELFDLLQEIMRHYACPESFIDRIAIVFQKCRLAYVLDASDPISIIPAVTHEEGQSILASMCQLRFDGLTGAVAHLRQASQSLNQGEWSDSIRESIHAVESVARQMDQKSSTSLGPALKSLERHGDLHPALKEAFSKLYGYTSDEEGIRHALLDSGQSKPQLDEAVFMLGACAAFASYLSRKHAAPKQPAGAYSGDASAE